MVDQEWGEWKVKFLGLKIEGQPRRVQLQMSTGVWSLHLQETKPSPIVCFKPDKGGKGLFIGCHELWSVGSFHVYLMSSS